LKQEWQKSPAGTRQTDGKNMVWFGEIDKKLAKLSKTTFTYCLPLNYSMGIADEKERAEEKETEKKEDEDKSPPPPPPWSKYFSKNSLNRLKLPPKGVSMSMYSMKVQRK
jgi:hypothetical protein